MQCGSKTFDRGHIRQRAARIERNLLAISVGLYRR